LGGRKKGKAKRCKKSLRQNGTEGKVIPHQKDTPVGNKRETQGKKEALHIFERGGGSSLEREMQRQGRKKERKFAFVKSRVRE